MVISINRILQSKLAKCNNDLTTFFQLNAYETLYISIYFPQSISGEIVVQTLSNYIQLSLYQTYKKEIRLYKKFINNMRTAFATVF